MIDFNAANEPDFKTIIWRHYFSVCKDASKASEMANAYLAFHFPKVQQPYF